MEVLGASRETTADASPAQVCPLGATRTWTFAVAQAAASGADSLDGMSPLKLRRSLRRLARRRAVAVGVLLTCWAIAIHHVDVAAAGTSHEKAGAVAGLCLGVVTAVGVTAAIAIGVVHFGRGRRPTVLPCRGTLSPVVAPQACARAGPLVLSQLCVRRR
jgi:hypothetical protein